MSTEVHERIELQLVVAETGLEWQYRFDQGDWSRMTSESGCHAEAQVGTDVSLIRLVVSGDAAVRRANADSNGRAAVVVESTTPSSREHKLWFGRVTSPCEYYCDVRSLGPNDNQEWKVVGCYWYEETPPASYVRSAIGAFLLPDPTFKITRKSG